LLAVFTRENDTHARRPRTAVATWLLIALCLAVYLLQSGGGEQRFFELILRFGVTPEIFTGGDRPFGHFPPLLTPLTSLFLHGSLDHLLFNLIYLWIFGRDIEAVLGPFRFVLFWLACGVCGALGYVLTDSHTTLPLIGATGCVAGLIVASVMLKPCGEMAFELAGRLSRVPSYWVIGSWLLVQLFQYLWWHAEDEFSTLAQPGGAISALFAFWLLCPRGIRLFECHHAGQSGTHN
jgi:membrane associated rhomboid family serine protease